MIQNVPLSYPAARLLIRLLEISGVNESREEMMAAASIRSRSQFFGAQAELRRRGFLNEDGSLEFAGQHIDTGSPLVLAPFRAPKVPVVLSGDTPRQRSVEVDLMDASGDQARPGTPFQIRRKAQIEFIQDLWVDSFHAPVSVAEAKILLNLAGNYTEDILDRVEEVLAKPKKIDWPLGYIKAILKKNQAAEVASSAPAKTIDDEYGEIVPDDVRVPDAKTEETRQILKALGKI
jgi:hypothetical protein